jgi:hypothetical protein
MTGLVTSCWKTPVCVQVPDMDFITHNSDSCPENGQPLIGVAAEIQGGKGDWVVGCGQWQAGCVCL